MWAALFDHRELVHFFLDYGASANAKNDKGRTALMLAALRHHEKMVRYLLAHGADITVKDSDGRTVLTYALAVIDDLRKPNIKIITLLLAHGLDINERDRGDSLIFFVIQSSFSDKFLEYYITIMKLLLDHGANVNAVTDDSDTALHMAIFEGKYSIVQLFLDHGANPNTVVGGGQS